MLREPVAAAVCDSVRVLGELPPWIRTCARVRCPRGGSYSIYKHICPGGAGDLIAGGCVSAPSASKCELISVWWGSSPWGELYVNHTGRARYGMTYVWILSCSYSMSGAVELETEVRDWLDGLSAVQFAAVAFCVDLLAERGPFARRAVHPVPGQEASGTCANVRPVRDRGLWVDGSGGQDGFAARMVGLGATSWAVLTSRFTSYRLR